MHYKTLFILILYVFTPLLLTSQESQRKSSFTTFKESLTMPLDGRVDYSYVDYENSSDQFKNINKFEISNLIYQIRGSLNPNISIHFRTVFDSNLVNSSNILDNIQCASVNYLTSNEHWLFKAGRFIMSVGTVEQLYNGSDVYVYSVAGNNFGVFKTGFNVQYITNDRQRIGFQVVNADDDLDESQFTYNVNWMGHLFDNKIQTYMSLSTSDKIGDMDMPYGINLGVRWNLQRLKIDTDFAMVKNMANFYRGGEYISVPIKVEYSWDHFRPYVKYIYNQVDFGSDGFKIPLEDGTSETLEFISIHSIIVALQYYPIKSRNLRFHLATSITSDRNISLLTPDPSVPNSRPGYNAKLQIMAGLRIRFDLIKGWN
ncbi:porin [Prolixibacteraceae bacterium]|nr:porin [Prolixibacteraceae bacterium]